MWVLVTTMLFVQEVDKSVIRGSPMNYAKVYDTLSRCEKVIDDTYQYNRDRGYKMEFIFDAKKKRVLKETELETVTFYKCVKASWVD